MRRLLSVPAVRLGSPVPSESLQQPGVCEMFGSKGGASEPVYRPLALGDVGDRSNSQIINISPLDESGESRP